jgi:nicotinamide-nucleotide amidase
MKRLLRSLKENRLRLATSESLTGGMIASALVSLPGASKVYWGGVVAYTRESKECLSAVDSQVIERYGIVSGETATAMARGIRERSGVDIAIALTGVAGPYSDSDEAPVGTVWISCATNGKNGMPHETTRCYRFRGSRNRIRKSSLKAAVSLALTCIDRKQGPAYN